MNFRLGVTILSAALFGCGGVQRGATETTGETSVEDSGGEPTTIDNPVTSGECLGDPATTTTASGADGEVCAQTNVDACCCFDPDDPFAAAGCGRRYLCEDIVYSCGEDFECSRESVTTECPGAIDCALAALAQGTPGTLRVNGCFQMGHDRREINIVGDGTGFYALEFNYDLGCDGPAVIRRALKPAAYFSDCAAKPSAFDRLACVKDPFTGTILETCNSKVVCDSF